MVSTHTAKQEGDRRSKRFVCSLIYGKSVMSAQMLELSLLGVGAVLRLERDALSMNGRMSKASNK